MPKVLFTNTQFKSLSCEAKLLYGLLLDRMQLSIKNRWLDEEGKVYIYFSQEQISGMMGCGLKKVGNLLAELDSRKGIGLITRIRQGLGRPDRIYVRKCTQRDMYKRNIQTRQNDISGNAKMTGTDMSEMPGNDTEDNKTEIMELDMVGDQRTALFIIISDTDDTFNFVVAMMYSQLFNLLCDRADDVHHGRYF